MHRTDQLSSVNQFIHCWTKCRHSIRILKSAILPHFRCQTALTRTSALPEQRASTSKLEIEFGNWMCQASDYRMTFDKDTESRRTRRLLTRISVKEVIQPQVPLRLPCYDFAPVTALAFGRLILLRGFDTDFGRSQLPWRDGRCVQGPGTYSPWRS